MDPKEDESRTLVRQSPNDISHSSKESLSPEDAKQRIKELFKNAKPALDKVTELDKFPEGVQFDVMGPKVPINTEATYREIMSGKVGLAAAHVWGADGDLGLVPYLGSLSITGSSDEMTLEYRPKVLGGNTFTIKVGGDVEIGGGVSAQEVYEALQFLISPENGLNNNRDSLHIAPSRRNLHFFDKDGNSLNSDISQQLRLSPTSPQLSQSNSNK